jgi:hypothetical protein
MNQTVEINDTVAAAPWTIINTLGLQYKTKAEDDLYRQVVIVYDWLNANVESPTEEECG